MAETYSFELAADVKAARKAVEGFASETQKQLDTLNVRTGISAIESGFNLAKQFIGGTASVLSGFIEESIKADNAQRSLANAMRLSGEFSAAASDRALEYANSLSKVTVHSDDAVVSALALAKSYQLTNSESRKVVAAATDLAAVTGKDLNTAVRELSETYGGHIKGLQKQFTELKRFSESQLQAGAAVDFLANKLKGSAAEALKSYSGQQEDARKTVQKFQQDVGDFLNRSIAVYIRWGKAVKAELSKVTRENQLIIDQMDNRDIFSRVDAVYAKLRTARELDKKEADANAKAVRDRIAEVAAEKAKAELEQFKTTFTEKRKEILLRSLSEQGKIEQKFQDDSLIIARGYGLGLIKDSKEFLAIIKGLKENELKEEAALQAKFRAEGEAAEAKFDEQKKKNLEAGVKDPIKQLIIFGAELDRESAIGVGAGLLSAVTKGAQGASKLISSSIGDALSVALTGSDILAGPIGDMIDLLGQGPEKTKEMVSQFIDAIPVFIENLAKSLPVLIETIAEKLPAALAKTMPTVAIGFTTELVKHIPDIIKGFVDGLIEGAKAFVDKIIELVTGGLSDIGGAITGSGSGSVFEGIPVLGGIGDLLGIAGGGTTPDSPGLKGDKFGPVMLDADETILDHSLTKQLRNALDGGGLGGAPTTVVIQIGQSEMARVLLDLNRGGFRTA